MEYLKRGFTMVELIIVIVIIGLLVSVVIVPKVGRAMDKAQITKAQATIDQLNSAISGYMAIYPTEAGNFGSVEAAFTALSPFLGSSLNKETLESFCGEETWAQFDFKWGQINSNGLYQFYATPKEAYVSRFGSITLK